MDFKKLPSNSEKLLREIVCADNPVQVLCARFENASRKEDTELRGIIRELHQEGYIDVMWADNVPISLPSIIQQEYMKSNSLNLKHKNHVQCHKEGR